MVNGIAIVGLNGSGKSTLTHALAQRIHYFEMDMEDYYFPEQRDSRRQALENDGTMVPQRDGHPFSNPQLKDQVENAILEDMKTHTKFILSGVTMNWHDEILSRIDVAFWIQVPLETSIRRIRAREEKRFGARVLPGGDLYEQQEAFHDMVKNRGFKAIEESAMKIGCPVVVLDGTRPVEESLKRILEYLKQNT